MTLIAVFALADEQDGLRPKGDFDVRSSRAGAQRLIVRHTGLPLNEKEGCEHFSQSVTIVRVLTTGLRFVHGQG